MKKKILALAGATLLAAGVTACKGGDEGLRMNLSFGAQYKTMTYNQDKPLDMPDGTVISKGDLKPFWQKVEQDLGFALSDVANQTEKSSDMIKNNKNTSFEDAVIFGGNSIGDDLMQLGAEEYFVSLSENIDKLPNFKAYLEKNPDVKKAITAYDGGIYHIPYIAEIGNYARVFTARQSWITALLDGKVDGQPVSVAYSTNKTIDTKAAPVNVKDGKSTRPANIDGVALEKKGNDNITLLMNNLAVKNGATLQECFVNYINANYDVENPSDLFLGDTASYDMDELIALWRVVEANTDYLVTLEEGALTATTKDVVPFFTRLSKYREDVLRFSTYINGTRMFGSDSYESRWYIDGNNEVQYTYSQETTYDVASLLGDLLQEGALNSTNLTLSDKTDFRQRYYGSDSAKDQAMYGFMTFDFPASTTSDSLNKDVVAILPPVASVNGIWQQYVDNTRVIKPDGWAISAASSEEEIAQAFQVFDYMFSEEGNIAQNYGVNMADGKYEDPVTGAQWPKYDAWVLEKANEVAKGDVSTFLREFIGSHLAIGYQKEIGFEYQYTSERGLEAYALYSRNEVGQPSYDGKSGGGKFPAEEENIEGFNQNYYKLTPPVFSLNKGQADNIATLPIATNTEYNEIIFNVIKYKHTNAPEGVKVFKTYDAFLGQLKADGLERFIATYQAAYNATK